MLTYPHEKMRKSSPLLLLTVLLLSLFLCWSRAEASAEIEYVPKGWTSQAEGYWLTEKAGRDVLTGWKIDREEKEIYKEALNESEKKLAELKDVVGEEFANIKAAHEEDRAEWKRALHKARAPGVGVFAGVGYTTNQEFEGVVGVGIVLKIW